MNPPHEKFLRMPLDLLKFEFSELYRREGAAMGLQTGRRNSNNRGGSKSAAATAERPVSGDSAEVAIVRPLFVRSSRT